MLWLWKIRVLKWIQIRNARASTISRKTILRSRDNSPKMTMQQRIRQRESTRLLRVPTSRKNLLKSKPPRLWRKSRNQWAELVKADIRDQLLPHHQMKTMMKTSKVLKNCMSKPKEGCFYCSVPSTSSSSRRGLNRERTLRASTWIRSQIKQNRAKDKPPTALWRVKTREDIMLSSSSNPTMKPCSKSRFLQVSGLGRPSSISNPRSSSEDVAMRSAVSFA